MLTENSGDNWYAVRVRPRHEKSVSHMLRSKGFEEFLPYYVARRLWGERARTVDLPLFPGYTFSRFSIQKYFGVLATPGIVEIVRDGSGPAPIDASEIAALQRAVESRLPLDVYAELISGERVRVFRGPLAGLEGTIVRVSRRPRLILSLTLLRQSVLVEVDRDWVLPIKSQSGGFV